MNIQINTDKNLNLHEEFEKKLDAVFIKELDRFSEQITRLEVHLSDENGHKDLPNDKRCLIEARLKGKQPVAVTNDGNDYEKAVSGAIQKLKAHLDTLVGKSKNY